MKDIYDVIIIGAGACGLFTAINMAEIAPKKKILILEKGKEALGKVRILLIGLSSMEFLLRKR